MDELTRDGQPAPILIVDESAGWESGPCPDVEDDHGADAAEQIGKLRAMIEIALERRDETAGGARWTYAACGCAVVPFEQSCPRHLGQVTGGGTL